MWCDTLDWFIRETPEFKVHQIGRCAFGRRALSSCIYVDDLPVFGSTSVVSEVSATLRARFPLTNGAPDCLGIKFDVSTNGAYVHQGAYVAKVVGYTKKPVHHPLSQGHSAELSTNQFTRYRILVPNRCAMS